MVGQEMIFPLYSEIQEYLIQHNKQQMSFYDEMQQQHKGKNITWLQISNRSSSKKTT